MYTARWIGDGSFEVNFNDGKSIECYIDGDKVFPDIPEINQEIRNKFKELIVLRKKLSEKLHE